MTMKASASRFTCASVARHARIIARMPRPIPENTRARSPGVAVDFPAREEDFEDAEDGDFRAMVGKTLPPHAHEKA